MYSQQSLVMKEQSPCRKRNTSSVKVIVHRLMRLSMTASSFWVVISRMKQSLMAKARCSGTPPSMAARVMSVIPLMQR